MMITIAPVAPAQALAEAVQAWILQNCKPFWLNV